MPKHVLFYETGGADVLKVEELPLKEPGQGEVRLKVEAIGLNRAEIMFRNGQYLQVPEFPSRLGYEAAGVIDAIGPDVTGFKVGDRVSTIPAFSMGQYGVYGESAIVPVHAVASYPDSLTATEGTSIWMQYLTAFGALVEYGRVKENDAVLITAASSSVGLGAIQIAKAAGAVAIATTRGPRKRQSLLEAGADHVIVTDEEDLSERVMAITDGKGANIIFDPIGGPQVTALAQAAAQGATIFEYGGLSPEPTPYPLLQALRKGLSVRGYTLFEITGDAEKLARAKHYINDGLQSGALKPILARTFSLDNISDAHRFMESNQQIGKIVVLT